MPTTAEALKSFAERDKTPLAVMPSTKTLIEPPGWAFCFSYPAAYAIKSILKWISEEHWDYTKGVPKIGCVGWREAYGVDLEEGMREYCQAHPGKFQWVAGLLPPRGTMTWAGEVEKLKDCDYIAIPQATVAMGSGWRSRPVAPSLQCPFHKSRVGNNYLNSPLPFSPGGPCGPWSPFSPLSPGGP